MTEWVFAQLDPAAVRRDPNETQLFKDNQAGEDEYAGTDALVREILQNSMDAGTDEGPVRVRLALHSAKEMPSRDRLKNYFRRLQTPLQKREIDFERDCVPCLSEGFMVVEDFGTRGLGGDPLLSKEPQPGIKDRQDFFWFWRNIGLSGKTGDDLGRWGLGKTVYRAASRVGCMFGLTVRQSDDRRLLMGQSVLHIHEIDGQQYLPEGFWCNGTDNAGVPQPIESPDQLATFAAEWKLTRTNEPGLSVVVPYVASELTGKRILQAVCINFFLQILRGELEVEVAAPDIDTGRAYLSAESIEDWTSALKWDGPKRTKRHCPPPIAFVRQCINLGSHHHTTKLLGTSAVPVMNEDAFADVELNQLRSLLADEDLVAVKVRIQLAKRSGEELDGHLSVFLQRQQDEHRFDTYYVREGMTITKLNSKAALKGIKALVIVDGGPLAQLLGDSEGPAHEDWNTSAERPDKIWKRGWKGRVTFCRKIVDSLLEVLAPPKQEADFDLLSDFFSIEKAASPQKSKLPADDGNGAGKLADIAPKLRWYRLDGKRGGFRIVSTNAEPVPPNAELQISVAYDVPTGNPLKKWSNFDFDFKRKPCPIVFDGQNVKAKTTAGNVLKLNCTGPKFVFAADGFDTHADLFVRIDELSDTVDPETEQGNAEATEGNEQ